MDFFNLFRRGNGQKTPVNEEIIQELHKDRVTETKEEYRINEIPIQEDHSGNELLSGDIQSITESVTTRSLENVAKLIESNEAKAEQILSELKADYSLEEIYKENEEMSRDSIVGSAMELIADDVCQVDEKAKVRVSVEAKDVKLQKFLQDFLENNINVEDRVWEWAYEVVKHGDFKLRRREYYVGDKNKGVKDVYYENVIDPYKVSRIEYMGKVLGYMDSEFDPNKTTFEKADQFVHFLNSKLPRREKVKVKIKNEEDSLEEVVCTKVNGVSLVDNSRYIYRVVNLLDNMLVMSRVARSTQYNLVKIEVGNASPAMTQQILMDVRRRIEGATKIKKNRGIKSDPSPIPVNSNVYIPTRDGKGDVTVDSINETVDVRSITDIDYFRDKEFATLKVPKAYLGFEESMPGTLGNESLVKFDIRYARSAQRVQTVLRYGIEDLCNNYLRYRGRVDDVGKFDIHMRVLTTSETASRVESFVQAMQVFDTSEGMVSAYEDYVDRARLFNTLINLVGLTPSDLGSEKFIKVAKDLEEGTYKEEEKSVESEEETDEEW